MQNHDPSSLQPGSETHARSRVSRCDQCLSDPLPSEGADLRETMDSYHIERAELKGSSAAPKRTTYKHTDFR